MCKQLNPTDYASTVMHCARCVQGDSIRADPRCAHDRLRCRGPTVDAHASGPVTARQARSIRFEEAKFQSITEKLFDTSREINAMILADDIREPATKPR
jgi:hypothetical protein